MIARVSGTVWSVGEGYIVMRVGGVGGIGLEVRVPASSLAKLGHIGRPVELFTHLYIRENEWTLFGFLSEEELSLFKLFLTVSGIGPKTALALVSDVSPETLRQAVAREDASLLSRTPGVGAKTAKAIIFHLKDKLGPLEVGAAPLLSDRDAEVIAALTALGFSLVEAQTAIQSLPRDEDMSVEERVRRALAYFAAP